MRSLPLFASLLLLGGATAARADVVQYYADPDPANTYPDLTDSLTTEFGPFTSATVPETVQTTYVVQGSGNVSLNFFFRADTGSYQFNFGFYRITPALNAINTSTDAGKQAYATAALAPGSATLVFDDNFEDPDPTGTTPSSFTVAAGTTLGFFLIPNNTLSDFRSNPGNYDVTGNGSGNPFPLFSVSGSNPGGFDQLLSFSGTSAVTSRKTSLFAWEDLTRAGGSDSNFNDLVFTVEGVQAVPEPTTLAVLALGGLAMLRRRRR